MNDFISNYEHINKKFPCKNCLIKPMCRDYTKCIIVTQNKSLIDHFVLNRNCPDCGGKNCISENDYIFKCEKCNHKFKRFGPVLMERVL